MSAHLKGRPRMNSHSSAAVGGCARQAADMTPASAGGEDDTVGHGTCNLAATPFPPPPKAQVCITLTPTLALTLPLTTASDHTAQCDSATKPPPPPYRAGCPSGQAPMLARHQPWDRTQLLLVHSPVPGGSEQCRPVRYSGGGASIFHTVHSPQGLGWCTGVCLGPLRGPPRSERGI